MSLFFLFIAISSVSHPTGSNGRYAKYAFSPCEEMISQLSLCLPLTAISYKRLVTGFRFKYFSHSQISSGSGRSRLTTAEPT